MTSFVAASQGLDNEGRKSDAPTSSSINLYKTGSNMMASPEKNKLIKSPLKPSNESLLEHYKYEK